MKIPILAVLVLLFSSRLVASVETDFNRGVELFKAGNYATAIVQFESALQQGMGSIALHYNLASCYYRLGDYQSSRKYFMRVAQSAKMKDLAEYNLGLIALKLNETSTASNYFTSISRTSQDKKLVALSTNQLADIKQDDDRLAIYVSSNMGYDDNITASPDDTTLGLSDTFYDLYLSLDFLIAGERKQGWAINASYFKIDYSDTDDNDEYQYSTGLKREHRLSDWDTTIQLNISKSNFAGADYQSAVKLDMKGKKFLSQKGQLYLRYRYDNLSSEHSNYDYLAGWRQRARVEYRRYASKHTRQIYYELELNDRRDLITSNYAYDYSPTRHTLRAMVAQDLAQKWRVGADLSYRFSDYPSSDSFDRDDDQWKASLSTDYRFDRTFRLNTKLQYSDNASTVDRYTYDRATIKVGISKLF